MARRSDRSRQAGRGAVDTTTRVLRSDYPDYLDSHHLLLRSATPDRHVRRQQLVDAYRESLPFVEDLRRYVPVAPSGNRYYFDEPRRTVSGRPVRYRAVRNRSQRVDARYGVDLQYPHFKVGFEKPRTVVECLRRHIRKQVLHAFKIAGRGSKTFRRRRNKWSSAFSC